MEQSLATYVLLSFRVSCGTNSTAVTAVTQFFLAYLLERCLEDVAASSVSLVEESGNASLDLGQPLCSSI